MSLTGAGRASGATITGINAIAERAESPTGLSVSEARELAAALAATGKVANDNILKLGLDEQLKNAQERLEELSAFGGSSGGGLFGGLASLFGLGGGGAGAGSGYAMSSGLGAGTGGLSFPMFAGGTNFAPGGPSIINEGGMGEIVDLPTGARVIPHDVSMEMARASANDNGGVTMHEGDTYISVQGDANEKTLAAMQSELSKRDKLRRANFINDYKAAKTGRLI